MTITLPTVLTILRIALIPVIAGLIALPSVWAAWGALALYVIACATDWFDGYLARRMGTVSAFGRFLDPIADKLLIAVMLLVFAGIDRLDGWWLLPACIILFREVLIAGLREFLGPQNIVIPVSRLAKWKTASQMIALGFLVVGNAGDIILPHTLLIGQILLSLSAALTALTGWDYMRKGLEAINAAEDKPRP